MAEVLLRARLGSEDVTSAGFLVDGEPATDDAIATMAARGLDLSSHTSRVVTPEMLGAADLIVTMTAQHIAELASVEPAAWRRAFTLRDLVRRAETIGPRRPDEPVAEWADRMGEGRTPRDVLSASSRDDVGDPIGQPIAAYQQTADDLDDLLGRLARALTP